MSKNGPEIRQLPSPELSKPVEVLARLKHKADQERAWTQSVQLMSSTEHINFGFDYLLKKIECMEFGTDPDKQIDNVYDVLSNLIFSKREEVDAERLSRRIINLVCDLYASVNENKIKLAKKVFFSVRDYLLDYTDFDKLPTADRLELMLRLHRETQGGVVPFNEAVTAFGLDIFPDDCVVYDHLLSSIFEQLWNLDHHLRSSEWIEVLVSKIYSSYGQLFLYFLPNGSERLKEAYNKSEDDRFKTLVIKNLARISDNNLIAELLLSDSLEVDDLVELFLVSSSGFTAFLWHKDDDLESFKRVMSLLRKGEDESQVDKGTVIYILRDLGFYLYETEGLDGYKDYIGRIPTLLNLNEDQINGLRIDIRNELLSLGEFDKAKNIAPLEDIDSEVLIQMFKDAFYKGDTDFIEEFFTSERIAVIGVDIWRETIEREARYLVENDSNLTDEKRQTLANWILDQKVGVESDDLNALRSLMKVDSGIAMRVLRLVQNDQLSHSDLFNLYVDSLIQWGSELDLSFINEFCSTMEDEFDSMENDFIKRSFAIIKIYLAEQFENEGEKEKWLSILEDLGYVASYQTIFCRSELLAQAIAEKDIETIIQLSPEEYEFDSLANAIVYLVELGKVELALGIMSGKMKDESFIFIDLYNTLKNVNPKSDESREYWLHFFKEANQLIIELFNNESKLFDFPFRSKIEKGIDDALEHDFMKNEDNGLGYLDNEKLKRWHRDNTPSPEESKLLLALGEYDKLFPDAVSSSDYADLYIDFLVGLYDGVLSEGMLSTMKERKEEFVSMSVSCRRELHKRSFFYELQNICLMCFLNNQYPYEDEVNPGILRWLHENSGITHYARFGETIWKDMYKNRNNKGRRFLFLSMRADHNTAFYSVNSELTQLWEEVKVLGDIQVHVLEVGSIRELVHRFRWLAEEYILGENGEPLEAVVVSGHGGEDGRVRMSYVNDAKILPSVMKRFGFRSTNGIMFRKGMPWAWYVCNAARYGNFADQAHEFTNGLSVGSNTALEMVSLDPILVDNHVQGFDMVSQPGSDIYTFGQ